MNNKVRSYVSQNSNSLNAMIKKTPMTTKRHSLSHLKFGLLAFTIPALIVGGAFSSEGIYEVFAAKPTDGDGNYLGNGYPSGEHYNMNVHGKKIGQPCDPTSGGNNVFILAGEPGNPKDSTVTIVQNKKSTIESLTAIDPCAEHWNNAGVYCDNECGDAAKVQLPYDSQGYLLFARVPGNFQYNPDANIVIYPNPAIMACDTDDPNITNCDDDVLALGMVTKDGVFDIMENEWVKDLNSCDKGQCKGKSKATDISELYNWTGYICDDSADLNGDGILDEADALLAGYDVDFNGISAEELQAYLDDLVLAETCTHHDSEFVFNLADLVGVDNTFENEGTKLLKFRWYGLSGIQWN